MKLQPHWWLSKVGWGYFHVWVNLLLNYHEVFQTKILSLWILQRWQMKSTEFNDPPSLSGEKKIAFIARIDADEKENGKLLKHEHWSKHLLSDLYTFLKWNSVQTVRKQLNYTSNQVIKPHKSSSSRKERESAEFSLWTPVHAAMERLPRKLCDAKLLE